MVLFRHKKKIKIKKNKLIDILMIKILFIIEELYIKFQIIKYIIIFDNFDTLFLNVHFIMHINYLTIFLFKKTFIINIFNKKKKNTQIPLLYI